MSDAAAPPLANPDEAPLPVSQPTAAELRECEDEPIRVPGTIQPHGVLLSYGQDGRILRASGNAAGLLGADAASLLGRPLREAVRTHSERVPSTAGLAQLLSAEPPSGRPLLGRRHAAGGETVLELTEAPAGPTVGLGEVAAPLLKAMQTWQTVADFEDGLAAEFRRVCGFDRVMIYRFAEDHSGEVVGECRAEGLEPFHGLRYPAADIPAQARQLYLECRVRALADVDYEPVAVAAVPHRGDLDMSGCALRSMSPIHRIYLKNMGVTATLTISLVVGGRLWGLVSCHHYSPRPVDFEFLEACEAVSELASVKLTGLLAEETRDGLAGRFEYHNSILQTLQEAADVSDRLSDRTADLMRMMDADGVALVFGESVLSDGEAPPDETSRLLAKVLSGRDRDEVFVSDNIARDLSAEGHGSGLDLGETAGLTAMQFWPDDYILFYRNEQARGVRWGGNPAKGFRRDERGRLLPRSSFAEWVESVTGTSRPWTEVDRRTAETFRSALAVFIIRRSHELRELNRKLRAKTLEIQQFVYSISHDLKSPLVTCRGFLGLLREDLENGELADAADSIERAERATETMNAFIEDLLQFSRIGRASDTPAAPVDLDALADDVLEELAAPIAERGVTVLREGPLPTYTCRRTDMRRVFANLLQNCLKYACDGGEPRILIRGVTNLVEHVITVRDWGPGIEEQYHAKAMQLFQRVHAKKSGSGVGLASVAKTVEMLGGRVWLSNPEGGGLAVNIGLPNERLPPP